MAEGKAERVAVMPAADFVPRQLVTKGLEGDNLMPWQLSLLRRQRFPLVRYHESLHHEEQLLIPSLAPFTGLSVASYVLFR